MDRGSWHCIGGKDQDQPQEKGKMVVWGGLTNSWEKKRSERQRRKKNDIPIWMHVLWVSPQTSNAPTL